MNAWWNLVKKEYRMERNLVAVLLGMLIIGGLWAMFYNRDSLGIIMAPASMLLITATFVPAILMLKSINGEVKQTPHLWLHCPYPAWMLLSAKLVVAMAAMLAVLAVDALFVYLTIVFISEEIGVSTGNLVLFATEVGSYLGLAIIGLSIYMAAWSSLVVVATASVRSIFGRFNWLAGLGIFFLATWGVGKFHHTWFYDRLTKWGAFKINLITADQVLPAAQHIGAMEIYAGQIILPLIVAMAVFALSAWLLDNKVEV
ncbi:hypothetical protein [Desulforamulus aquiferis]|uniref:ABC transporter n=1 Tax=Desulforamulus aquiferis TaxID=1397668 RepID=A0AAW7Z6B3_9FIRM|nr:hypothetical protein [Desulforamulus aquiferis]MDO7785734.1 hypothetical protein [Desulforamulus aquiferis]